MLLHEIVANVRALQNDMDLCWSTKKAISKIKKRLAKIFKGWKRKLQKRTKESGEHIEKQQCHARTNRQNFWCRQCSNVYWLWSFASRWDCFGPFSFRRGSVCKIVSKIRRVETAECRTTSKEYSDSPQQSAPINTFPDTTSVARKNPAHGKIRRMDLDKHGCLKQEA